MKKIQKKKTPSKTKSNIPDIEVWDDPVWRPALDALEGWQPDGRYTGRSDPAPLATLLCSGIPVPEAVTKRLGEFLYPPWGEKGPHFILKLPKKYSGDKGVKFIKEMLSLKREIENELGDPPNVEAAVAMVAKRTAAEIAHALGGRKVRGTWITCCPAHDDRTPSLSVRDANDSKVLVKCFAGCGQACPYLRRFRC